MPDTIISFSGAYRFLSNFYPTPNLVAQGQRFPTSEHLYQWSKMATDAGRSAVLYMMDSTDAARETTPGEAKRAARRHPMRDGWNAIKVNVMRWVVARKFADPALRAMLIATGDAELVEGNTWGDRFWGVCDGEGENHLGKILMAVRQQCREVETLLDTEGSNL